MEVSVEITFCKKSESQYSELIAKFKKLIADYCSDIAEWINDGKIVSLKNKLYNKCSDEFLHIYHAVDNLSYEEVQALLDAGVFDFKDSLHEIVYSDYDITRRGIESIVRGKKELIDKFNERLEKQNVTLCPVKNKKFSLYNYVLNKENSCLHGICYQHGYMFASDNKIMVGEKTDYSECMEGVSVDKDGNKRTWINRKFWDCFIHFYEQTTDTCYINYKSVLSFLYGVYKIVGRKEAEYTRVAFRMPNKKIIGINLMYAIKFFDVMKHYDCNELKYGSEIVPFIAKGEKFVDMVMSVLVYGLSDADYCFDLSCDE